MKTRAEFPFEVEEFADMGIVMPDGCRLSARVWMPKGADRAPVPAILEYLPYRKRDGTAARDALTHPYFAGHGYACLRVDMRGNGDSEGVMLDEYSEQELQDACDVIAWIRKQSWCSGKAGMMGISWGGFNALQVAAMRPPGLDAIVTLCSTDDRYADDIHFKGGALLNENLGWGGTMLSFSSRPPDPMIVGEKWQDMWLERLESQPFWPAVWLAHQTRSDYWKRGSVCQDFSRIKAATLAIGGWGDAYKNAVARLVQGIQAPVKGIIGPWIHKYPHFAVPHPQIGFLQEALRWWDRWLKGLDTGVENDPAMRIYIMDSVPPKAWHDERPGRWIGEENWPSPRVELQKMHFSSEGGLKNGLAEFVRNISSPADCGAAGGEYCAIWLGPEMPGDQRFDDAHSACFDSAALDRAVDITGGVLVQLSLSCDKPKGQIAIRLCDLDETGASARMTYGVLNLCHRESHEFPQAMVPGERIDIQIRLDDIAWRVPPGHRLRVAISTAYWPMIWPAPETAEITLFSGSLTLPVLSAGEAAEASFEPVEGAPAWRIETLRPPANGRRIEHDIVSGATTLFVEDDFGTRRDLDHGLEIGGAAREKWRIHADDPLSASGETEWQQTLRRGDWEVRTEARTSMRSDAQFFFLTGSVKAWLGENLVFEKNYDESIKRGHL